MISDVLFFIKLVFYVWAFIEVAVLTNLYNYARFKMTKSPIIKSLFFFLVAITFEIVYRFFLNYTVRITTVYHDIFRDGVIIPLFFTAITARRFRKESIKSDGLGGKPKDEV